MPEPLDTDVLTIAQGTPREGLTAREPRWMARCTLCPLHAVESVWSAADEPAVRAKAVEHLTSRHRIPEPEARRLAGVTP
jgi:hypothetical protein